MIYRIFVQDSNICSKMVHNRLNSTSCFSPLFGRAEGCCTEGDTLVDSVFKGLLSTKDMVCTGFTSTDRTLYCDGLWWISCSFPWPPVNGSPTPTCIKTWMVRIRLLYIYLKTLRVLKVIRVADTLTSWIGKKEITCIIIAFVVGECNFIQKFAFLVSIKTCPLQSWTYTNYLLIVLHVII